MPNAMLTHASAKGSTSGESENRRSASAIPAATYAMRKLTTHAPNSDALWIITGAEIWLYAHAPNVPCGESERASHRAEVRPEHPQLTERVARQRRDRDASPRRVAQREPEQGHRRDPHQRPGVRC